MSALAADAILLETRGTPVAAIGGEALIRTVGWAMARAHGFPDYPFVSLRHVYQGQNISEEELAGHIKGAMPMIEQRLLRNTG